jgi:two-component system KDP operon response regulator KdpE
MTVQPGIRRFLKVALAAQGYTVFAAATGVEAVAEVACRRPDVVVLDLGLPDLDGIEVITLLREWTQLPIIILSERAGETDKITALDAGADDYLIKPFVAGELTARLRAVLRRAARTADAPIFSSGDLIVDLSRRRVTVAGREVKLTPTEYDLLRVLVTHAGKVLTHDQLWRQVWGHNRQAKINLLRTNIGNLRQKIEPDPGRPHYIVTEPGVGYRLCSQST